MPSFEQWQGWEGTPTALFKTLLEHAKTLNISTRQKRWPKAPHVLVRQLNELAPSLHSLGWEIVSSKSGIRRIGIYCVPSVQAPKDHENDGKTVDASQEESAPSSVQKTDGKTPSMGGRDAKDAISTSSLGSSEKPSVREVLEKIRFQFVEGTQEEWITLAVEAGLSEKDAETLFESLKGKELFWLDRPDGKTVWRWVNE